MALYIRKNILWRIYLMYLFLFLFGGLVIARVVKIQVGEGAFWNARANELTLHYANIEAVRGNIFDINGQLLATSLPYYEVAVDINSEPITDEIFESTIDSLSLGLAALFGDKTKSDYKHIFI